MSKFIRGVVVASGAAVALAGIAGAAGAAEVDVIELTIARAQQALAARQYTAEDLVKAYLARIEKYNSNYNAYITMNPAALDEARAIDRRRAAGEKLGPLAGIPIAIKESVDVAGLPATSGWAPLSKRAGGVDLIPERDATVVARLRAAGAVILGKTNIPAFSADGARANSSWAGPTYNVYDRSLVPGASSSGSASAVSGNLSMVAIAEETGGSIQNPSAAQGIVGIHPTFALVPTDGLAPAGVSTRDVLGPFARTVTDAAIVLDALAGYSAEDAKTVAAIGNIPKGGYTSKLDPNALKGKRIGLYGPGWRSQPLSPETQQLYERAKRELTAAGAVLVDDPFAGTTIASLSPTDGSYDSRGQESVAYDFEVYLKRLGPSNAITSLATMKRVIGKSPFDDGEPLARYRNHPVTAASLAKPDVPPDLSQFRALREQFLEIINEVFKAKQLDAIVYPQMVREIPQLDSKDRYAATTVSEIDIAGLPAVNVPAGTYPKGAPFSLIFVGRMWSEADMLGLAYAYEQTTKHRRAPDLVAAEQGK